MLSRPSERRKERRKEKGKEKERALESDSDRPVSTGSCPVRKGKGKGMERAVKSDSDGWIKINSKATPTVVRNRFNLQPARNDEEDSDGSDATSKSDLRVASGLTADLRGDSGAGRYQSPGGNGRARQIKGTSPFLLCEECIELRSLGKNRKRKCTKCEGRNLPNTIMAERRNRLRSRYYYKVGLGKAAAAMHKAYQSVDDLKGKVAKATTGKKQDKLKGELEAQDAVAKSACHNYMSKRKERDDQVEKALGYPKKGLGGREEIPNSTLASRTSTGKSTSLGNGQEWETDIAGDREEGERDERIEARSESPTEDNTARDDDSSMDDESSSILLHLAKYKS